MAHPYGAFLGLVLTRLIVVGATLVVLWSLWRGLYAPAAGLTLALLYLVYLLWSYPTAVEPPGE